MFLNGDVWKIKLYPTRGSEHDGVRPCIIVSPNSMNEALSTIIVIPMTTQNKNWPTRIEVVFDDKNGQACIEHIRSVSKERFVEKLGSVSDIELAIIRKRLLATFSL
ncbi:MAG: type II toxin-antitoxin system PemK/MazF family toxin [Bdellovibrionales bacterium]|nr:type II toxin-antitoxin system PemK/MazF family toxin [Bdellovibrionales bacterium]